MHAIVEFRSVFSELFRSNYIFMEPDSRTKERERERIRSYVYIELQLIYSLTLRRSVVLRTSSVDERWLSLDLMHCQRTGLDEVHHATHRDPARLS